MSNCAICLCEIREYKELKCSHKFHTNCINRWLHLNNSCPICRAKINVKTPVKDSLKILGSILIEIANSNIGDQLELFFSNNDISYIEYIRTCWNFGRDIANFFNN